MSLVKKKKEFLPLKKKLMKKELFEEERFFKRK